jgi:hypothetical protein
LSPAGRLPDFLIIGAIKAATTWLTWQLRQSEAVFLPKPEPHYFSREHHRGLEWYRSLFTGARPEQIIGEKTADYLANPDAAARIAEILPTARLLVQLRNPVDRAYSDYCMLFRRGSVSSQIEEYLDPRRSQFRRFLENGLYHAHLTRWQGLFPREQLAIFLFEDVIAQPDATMREVTRHIGAADGLVPQPMTIRVNGSGTALLPFTLRRLLAPAKDLAVPLRGTRWFEAVRATMARPVDYPPLTDELRRQLEDFYAPDVAALAKLIDRDLSRWLPARAAA